MSDGGRKRDFWDILDILSKVTASVFLAALVFVIPTASQRIASSLDTGRLVQALIADLTTSDQQTRQDLALIALNRSVGQHNGQLVSEIAERIYFDLSQRETEQQSIGRVAYGVLASRDPVRASHVRDSIEAEAATSRPQIVSPPNADSVRGTLARSPQAELIARIHPNVAYIQFAAESDRASADALRGALTSAGFWTPATEQLDGNFNNWIRFFHDADEPAARRAQEVVERYFREQGRPMTFRVQNFSTSGFKAPAGQIEVWVRLR
jgi:hypothetical protein